MDIIIDYVDSQYRLESVKHNLYLFFFVAWNIKNFTRHEN